MSKQKKIHQLICTLSMKLTYWIIMVPMFSKLRLMPSAFPCLFSHSLSLASEK